MIWMLLPIVVAIVAGCTAKTIGRHFAIFLVLLSAIDWYLAVGAWAREARSHVVIEDPYARSPRTPPEIFGPALRYWYSASVDGVTDEWEYGSEENADRDVLPNLAPFYETEGRACLVPPTKKETTTCPPRT